MSPTSLAHLLPPAPRPQTQKSRLRSPTTLPIPSLSTDLARIYVHVHTVLVLLGFFFRFRSLVQDPVGVMTESLAWVGILQVVWCALCLPWVGMTGWAGAVKEGVSEKVKEKDKEKPAGAANSFAGSAGSMRRKSGQKTGLGGIGTMMHGQAMNHWRSKIMPTVLSTLLTLALPPLPLTLLSVLLGAPLYPFPGVLLPTLILSIHVSILAILPLFYTYGVSALAWRDIACAWLPFDRAGVWAGSVGCFVGGWLGAIPIALDWDRDWQAWPVTVLVGVYLGWAVGRTVTALGFGVGKRIALDEVEWETRHVAWDDQLVAPNTDGTDKTTTSNTDPTPKTTNNDKVKSSNPLAASSSVHTPSPAPSSNAKSPPRLLPSPSPSTPASLSLSSSRTDERTKTKSSSSSSKKKTN